MLNLNRWQLMSFSEYMLNLNRWLNWGLFIRDSLGRELRKNNADKAHFDNVGNSKITIKKHYLGLIVI